MPTSSDDVIGGLEKKGFRQSKGTGHRGDHRTYFRKRNGNTSQTVTIVIGKREIPTGTLRSMARQLGITFEEFKDWIGLKP